MSDFMEALVDLLPSHNSLKNPNNELRRVLDGTVGAWFDNYDIQSVYDNLFLTTASGGYLDLHGADYGVYRRVDESDEDYRNRIVQEKLEYLTPEYLETIFGLTLYAYVSMFDARENCLTSDNPYLSNQYMSIASNDVQGILNKKFILDNSILWLNDYQVDYIINSDDENLILNNIALYTSKILFQYFKNADIKSVKLVLNNAEELEGMFYNCSELLNVDLELVNCVNVGYCFLNCLSLQNVKFKAPNLKRYTGVFGNCDNIETIDVVIPDNMVTGFKSYVLGLNLENLTSFKINGVEQL